MATGKKRTPPTDAELPIVIDAMPLSLQPLVILAAAVGGRFGERPPRFRKRDFTVEYDDDGAVECVRATVAKAITYVPKEGRSEKGPKTEAGNRQVPFFGHDALIFASHLSTIGDPDQLLFTDATGDAPLPHGSFTWHWIKARKAANRPDLQLRCLLPRQQVRATVPCFVAEVDGSTRPRQRHCSDRYQHAGTRADELARRAAR